MGRYLLPVERPPYADYLAPFPNQEKKGTSSYSLEPLDTKIAKLEDLATTVGIVLSS